MENKKLNFGVAIKDAFIIGTKNAPSIVAAFFLWLITIWIPYINVGTTIALQLLPVELAKGNIINPLDIFASKWRRYMGEFFMTGALMVVPITISILFLLIPGIVLSLAWSLAFFILIEKKKNPIQSIKASNDATYGSKWNIFWVSLLIGVLMGIIIGIFQIVCMSQSSVFISVIVGIVAISLVMSIGIGTNAAIWKQLQDNVE